MNTEELKKLAMAATPGPWAHGVTWIEHLGGIVALGNTARSKQDVAYVASANPATILALIAERDELLAALKESQCVNFWVSCQRDVVEKCMCAGCIEDRAQEVIAKVGG